MANLASRLFGAHIVGAQVSLLIAFALVAAIFDIRTRKIPNVLAYGGMLLALAVQIWAFGVGGGVAAILGGLVTALVPLILFAAGGLGGGDVKLFGALGAIVGPLLGLQLLFLSMLLTVLVGFGKLAYRGELFSSIVRFARGRKVSHAQELRFAVVAFIAVVVTVWDLRLGVLKSLVG